MAYTDSYTGVQADHRWHSLELLQALVSDLFADAPGSRLDASQQPRDEHAFGRLRTLACHTHTHTCITTCKIYTFNMTRAFMEDNNVKNKIKKKISMLTDKTCY